ncbi:MAG: DoxX-like family protein [Bacteroidota bacterium]
MASSRSVARAARLALGTIWLAEGLFLKVLWAHPDELALVADSGLWWPTPAATLAVVGVLEAALGAVLLVGIKPRLTAAVAGVALVVITTTVVATDPTVLLLPFSPILKNLALLACTLAVWHGAAEVDTRPDPTLYPPALSA